MLSEKSELQWSFVSFQGVSGVSLVDGGVTEIIVQSRELVSGYTYEICMHGTVWLMLVVRLN